MQRTFFTTTLYLAFIFIIFSSCSGGKKGDGKKYDLSFDILKGASFTSTMNNDMEVQSQVLGFKVNMKINMNADMKFDLLPDSAGMKQVKMTYEQLTMKMDFGNPLLKKNMAKDGVDVQVNKMMSAFKGQSLLLLVNKNGVIQEILNKEEFSNKIKRITDSIANEGADGAGNDEVGKTMEQMYSKGDLQNMLGILFAVYNNQPIETGDNWTKEYTIAVNGIDTKLENRFKLLAVKDGIAEIELNGKVSSKGTTQQNSMNVETNTKGKQTGTIRLQLNNGHILLSDTKLEMEGDVTMMGMKIPMKAKVANIIKSQKESY
jgi:Family of unknown function (DUF6263)